MLRPTLTPGLPAPEDIGAAVVFLASAGAAFLTGHVLHVNGGALGSPAPRR
ncbi:SDR family oxidoreductase [Streptomyces olindensis]|uniref:SDR family oxidoreductase n=1 Tax=Streptomyces olindensis TaxID=358823 RepID=UPI00365154CB